MARLRERRWPCVVRAAVLACAVLAPASVGAQSTASVQRARTADNGSADAARRVSVFDTLQLFAGLDGSKQPQDLGINANMGVRLAVNAAVPVLRSRGVGLQVGTALNLSDAAVHVLDQVSSTSRRTQSFTTVGLFQRQPRFGWSLAYDHLRESYFDEFTLAQLRGNGSVRVAQHDEAGIGVTTPLRHATGMAPGTPVRLDPIGQVTAFERHQWASGARTTLWAGIASGHHNVVLGFPDTSEDRPVFVYGARLDLPLNDRLSITGSGNFLTPAATGTVDAYLGITVTPGRRATAARSTFAPALDVANNPEFPVDLRR